LIPLEIATGFYRSDSLPLAAQRCVNWLPVVPQAKALNQRALFDVPGIVTQTYTGDAVTGHNRGAVLLGSEAFFVNGQSFYRLNKGNVTNIGEVIRSSRVSMAVSTRYVVVVVPGVKAYAYDTQTTTLTEITDPDFIIPVHVCFKDGYFIFTATDGTVFFNSALNDPFNYNALDFGSAEVRPDKIVACHVNHNELFVCGEHTIELFQNIGGANFPFQRIQGANIQKGVHARHTLKDFDNSFVFVGGDNAELSAIWKVVGSASVEKISTSAIDNEIQKFTKDEISEAVAISYAFGGNFFVAFTFTSPSIPSKTFVYDATTSALAGEATWHERQSGTVEERWRVTEIVDLNGELLTFDGVDGRIGKMDKNTHTEYGDVIYREKTSQPFTDQGDPLFIPSIRLTMESGVGTIAGLDPQIRMDYSDDGGRTWSNAALRSYGKIGEYRTYPTWRRQGRVPVSRVLRFRTSEAVKSVIIKLEADVEQAA